jgi:hypothetical protein
VRAVILTSTRARVEAAVDYPYGAELIFSGGWVRDLYIAE